MRVSVGGLVFAFSGDLPKLPQDSLLFRFCAESAPADITVRIRHTQSLPVPNGARLLYTARGLRMRALETQRFACRYDMNSQNALEHAVLRYDTAAPDAMELFFNTKRMPLDAEGLLSSIGLETILLRHGRCILHASFISVRGRAILFTAPSGTGKSTQAELWRRHRYAEIINGDKAVICNRGEEVFACGLPLCGSSGICRNETIPLAAVVVLAQGKENSAVRLRGAQAMKTVLPQIYTQPNEPEAVNGALAAAARIAERVPVFFLRCLPDESAVTCLEEMLKKEI